MAQNVSVDNVTFTNTYRLGKPKIDVLARQHTDHDAIATDQNLESMYFNKRSSFKDRSDIQKKIDNRIEDQDWVKNLSYEKEIYVIFGNYFNRNMAMLSREIVNANADYVDRF